MRLTWIFLVVCSVLGAPARGQSPTSVAFPVSWAAQSPGVIVLGGTHTVAVCDPAELKIRHQWDLTDGQIADARVLDLQSSDQDSHEPNDAIQPSPNQARKKDARSSTNEGQGDRETEEPVIVLAGAWGDEQGFVQARTLHRGGIVWQRRDLERPVVCLDVTDDRVFFGDDRGRVECIAARTGKTIWARQFHAKLVTCVAVLPNGWLASADWTGKIIISNASNADVIQSFQQHRNRVDDLEAVPGSLVRLYSASRDGTVRLWYPQQHRLVRFVQLQRPVTRLLSLGDWTLLAACDDGQLHLLDMARARVVNSIDSGLPYVQVLARAGEERLFVSDGVSVSKLVETPVLQQSE